MEARESESPGFEARLRLASWVLEDRVTRPGALGQPRCQAIAPRLQPGAKVLQPALEVPECEAFSNNKGSHSSASLS